MLFTSPVYSQASGSIAGITYGHGRGGMFVRARKTPTNPDSERQRTIRHALATLGSYWGQTLTEVERNGWRLYASNVSWSNALGQTIFLTGHQHFIRSNVVRIQASIDILDDAPIIYDLGTFTAPTWLKPIASTQTIRINFTNTDDWAGGTNGYMLCWLGRPTNPGEKYFKGPWRYTGKITGNPAPPASPTQFSSSWRITIDQIIWARIRFIQQDGRMSIPIIIGPASVREF